MTESVANTPRLELQRITKTYPALAANDSIDIRVMPGEIHAVLGENGAGKSTLMKIIYGVINADEGKIFWDGKETVITNPAQARRLGIGMVFQHFSLFETLTVAENIALALEGKLALNELSDRIIEVSDKYGLPIEPRRLVHSLSVGERQRVEIVRCLLQEPSLLIMDEPTSVLTPQAVCKLFETLRQLADEDCSILYISHKLEEIQKLCHRATVLRRGKVTGTAKPAEETATSLAEMMIGKELPVCKHPEPVDDTKECLVVDNLSYQTDDPFGTSLKNINLSVRTGEIVGVAGVSGNGQLELLRLLSGEETTTPENIIRIMDHSVAHLTTGQRRDLGMSFVPEERLGVGSVPEMSLGENALLTAYRLGMIKYGLIQKNVYVEYAKKCINGFEVKCDGYLATASSLSGGNLQKFIMGREISLKPCVLIVAQPTWGLDVNATANVHQALIDLRNEGAALLIISEDLDELLQICDRIAVITEGQLSPAKKITETSREEIGLLMTGGRQPNNEMKGSAVDAKC